MSEELNQSQNENLDTIEMPKPTAWPLVVGCGIALVATGVATSLMISLAGFLILLFGIGGWMTVLISETATMEEPLVPEALRARPILPSARKVESVRSGSVGERIHMPEKMHPYSAGVKGGVTGGALMAVVALLYGLISGRGIWYPINLLSGLILLHWSDASVAQLSQFHLNSLIAAIFLHLAFSTMVGLFFGILLPTLPGSPLIWGGIIGPLLWTAGIYSFMGVLNPVMDNHVDWPWFVASQFIYGITVGIVVIRTEKISARRIEGNRNQQNRAGEESS